ncbi:MAG: transposase [Lentisphaeria bacterium]
MATAGRTILKRMDGICAYWTHDRLTNAAMEGFNNKVRRMILPAYGYRDYECAKLKVYELPSMEIKTQLLCSCP